MPQKPTYNHLWLSVLSMDSCHVSVSLLIGHLALALADFYCILSHKLVSHIQFTIKVKPCGAVVKISACLARIELFQSPPWLNLHSHCDFGSDTSNTVLMIISWIIGDFIGSVLLFCSIISKVFVYNLLFLRDRP